MIAELAPFAFLALVVIGFGLLIRHMMGLKKQLDQRTEELEIAVAPAGFFPSPARDRVAAELLEAPRFKDRRLELTGLFADQGPAGVRYVLDYSVRGGSSKSSTERGTAFAVRLTDRRLPRFVFRHSTVKMPGLVVAGLDKLINLRYPGFERVPLESVSPELAESLLYAEDRDSGVRILSADVIEALSRHDGWGIESTGQWLLAERDSHGRARAPDIATVVDQLQEFRELAAAFEL
jgi:hypothetical protein